MLLQALCIISYPLVNSNWSYSPETPNLGQIRWFLEPCDLEIWWMTLKNNRAPVLSYFKLCAVFQSHHWIQTGVTVQKCQIRVKIDNIFTVSPWNLTYDLEKQIGHLFYATSSFVHHFITIGEFKLKFKCGNAQFGSKSRIFRDVWPCN